jgi:hypothetical protein
VLFHEPSEDNFKGSGPWDEEAGGQNKQIESGESEND